MRPERKARATRSRTCLPGAPQSQCLEKRRTAPEPARSSLGSGDRKKETRLPSSPGQPGTLATSACNSSKGVLTTSRSRRFLNLPSPARCSQPHLSACPAPHHYCSPTGSFPAPRCHPLRVCGQRALCHPFAGNALSCLPSPHPPPPGLGTPPPS